MTEHPTWKKNKIAYDTEYNRQNIRMKHVMFNMRIPEEVELLEWLESQKSKSAYIKGLIRADMNLNKGKKNV